MSNYPTSIDDQTSLFNPADSSSTKLLTTTLAASCISTDTTLQLAASIASLGGPSSYGVVTIGDEKIVYASSAGSNLTLCIRGAFGTTAVGHAAGVSVRWLYSAEFDKALQSAITAIQTVIGITGAFNFIPSGTPVTINSASAGAGVPSQLIVKSAGNRAVAILSYGNGLQQIALGAYFDGTNYIADDTDVVILYHGVNTFQVLKYTGQTVGSVLSGATTPFTINSSNRMALLTGAAVDNIVTTVGSPGSDNSLATEKAIRTAIGAGSSFSGCSLYDSHATQTLSGVTLLTFDSELYDVGSYHSGSGSAMVVPTTGKYMVHANVTASVVFAGTNVLTVRIYVNGTRVAEHSADTANNSGGSGSMASSISKTLSLTSGDSVEIYVFATNNGTVTCDGTFAGATYFEIRQVG